MRWSEGRRSRTLGRLVVRGAPVLALLAAVFLPACVYFNTYYNAQKLFRQAEKARNREEEARLARGPRATTDKRGGRQAGKVRDLYDRAARRASKVIEEHPESELVDDAAFLVGRAFYWQGDYTSAIRTLHELQDKFSDSEYLDRARYWEGLCYEAQGIDGEARRAYRALFNNGAGKTGYQAGFRLGEIAFAQGQYSEAIQEYRATLETFPKAELRAQLWLRLGEALAALGNAARYDEALEAFAQVLRENPSTATEYRARLSIGRTLYARGDVDGALKAYTALLDESRFRSFEGQTRLLIGQYYQDRRLREQALDEYGRVRDDFPQTPASAMALYRTGLLYLQDYGQVERAREYFQEIRQEKPNSEADELGRKMLAHLAELDRRLKSIERADSLSAATDEARLDTARARLLQEDYFAVAELYRDQLVQADSAAHYFEEIARRFPDSEQLPRVLYSLAWIQREMHKDEDAARPYLERLVEEFPEAEHAIAARQWLGLEALPTSEERARDAFARIEALRLKNEKALEVYVPLLDSLERRYPATETAAQAAYLAAWAYENIAADSLEAHRRYAQLLEEHPRSHYAELVRQSSKARAAGLVLKLERDIKAISRVEGPGERLVLIAVEPDSSDSVGLANKYLGFALRAHRRGELELARRNYELSLEQVEHNAEALYGLGKILWEGGYFQDAKEHYLQALHYRAGLVQANYDLFAAYVAIGRADSANYFLREVIKRDRRNPQVQNLRSEFPELRNLAEPKDIPMEALENIKLKPLEEELRLPKRAEPRELPLVRRSVEPQYPPGASDTARVVLDVLIAKDGNPEIVEVFKGEPPFEGAAVSAAQKYTFFPAKDASGREVNTWVELVIEFAPPAGVASRPPARDLKVASRPDSARAPADPPYSPPAKGRNDPDVD